MTQRCLAFQQVGKIPPIPEIHHLELLLSVQVNALREHTAEPHYQIDRDVLSRIGDCESMPKVGG